MGGFLTESEKSISRSELGELMWIARLARLGARCGDSSDARTFGDINEVCKNPIDFEEKVKGGVVSDLIGESASSIARVFPHMPGSGDSRI